MMKRSLIYILFFSCKTMHDVLGVYSNLDKAKKNYEKFYNSLSGASSVNLFILEKELDIDFRE